MISKYLLIFVILISTSAAHAQLPFGLRGMQGGPSFSAFERQDTDIMTNPMLGIWGKAALTENSAIIWEINYVTKGAILRNKPLWDFDNERPYSIYSYSIFFKSVFYEVPIVLTFYLPLQKQTRLYFFSGPAVLFYQSDKMKIQRGSFLYEWQSGMNREFYRWWTYQGPLRRFGYHLGFGLQRHHFAFELRYSKMDSWVLNLIQNNYSVGKKIHCLLLSIKVDLVGLVKDRKQR